MQWSRLQFRFAKRDPMTSLPVEIIGLIFGHFGLNENLFVILYATKDEWKLTNDE